VHVGIDYGFGDHLGDAIKYAIGNTINSQGHISKAPQVNLTPTFSSPIYAAIVPFSVGDEVTHLPTGQACIITAVQFSNGQHTYDAALISDPSVTGVGLAASDLRFVVKPQVVTPPVVSFSVYDTVYHIPSGDYCTVSRKVISTSSYKTFYDVVVISGTQTYYSVPASDLTFIRSARTTANP